MNAEFKEYDQRQLKLMLDFIDGYETGRSGLGQLVSNLEALHSAMEDPSESFSDSFESLWGQLEVTYAMMLDEERQAPNKMDSRLVAEAIQGLKALIGSQSD